MDPVRVLLVEDDDDNRELMAEILGAAGCEVVSATSGREALRRLSECPVDVIVTDVGMPGMGGLELAVAAKAVAPSVPVVVVTGWAEREDITSAREVDAVLLKPVDPDVLAQAVSDVARRRRGA
jgi:CheY-like chemotaxis protein